MVGRKINWYNHFGQTTGCFYTAKPTTTLESVIPGIYPKQMKINIHTKTYKRVFVISPN